jgi:hypothetical protein
MNSQSHLSVHDKRTSRHSDVFVCPPVVMMTTRRRRWQQRRIFAVALLAGAAATHTLAAPTPPPTNKSLHHNRASSSKPVSVTATGASPLFTTLDLDNDGYLERDEIEAFLHGFGGVEFDSRDEREQATTDALDNVFEHASSGETSSAAQREVDAGTKSQGRLAVSPRNLARYWRQLGAEMDAESTAAWVEYAAGDGAAAASFRALKVMGYDFPGRLCTCLSCLLHCVLIRVTALNAYRHSPLRSIRLCKNNSSA